ncbi:MAG: MFS transporter [Proteobacteria bacterium]|nr:MFS transporter [Pseudomonadota bacterium]
MKRNFLAAWVVWATAAFFYLYEYILRVSPGAMTTHLMEAFQVSATSLGVLSSFYYYSYNVLQTPCGIIVDKLGPRFIITISCAICAFGAFLFYSTTSLHIAQLARFIMGIGSACAFVSTLKLTAAWFPATQFALVTGFTVTLGKLGGASQTIMAPIVESFGWQTLMLWLCFLGIFVALLCWTFIRNAPEGKKNTTIETFDMNTLLIVLKNKQVWYIGLIGGLMYIPITGFGELWSTPFLMCVCELDNIASSQITGLLYLGFATGGPLFAALSSVIKGHKRAMVISCILALCIFSVICYASDILPLYVIRILYFIGGMSMAGQVLCFTIAKENTPISVNGTTIGFTNTLVMLSAVICQPLIGKILDINWTGMLSDKGIRLYEKVAYQTASLSIPVGMILCLILLFFVKETYPKK